MKRYRTFRTRFINMLLVLGSSSDPRVSRGFLHSCQALQCLPNGSWGERLCRLSWLSPHCFCWLPLLLLAISSLLPALLLLRTLCHSSSCSPGPCWRRRAKESRWAVPALSPNLRWMPDGSHQSHTQELLC